VTLQVTLVQEGKNNKIADSGTIILECQAEETTPKEKVSKEKE
jgi:hypothetical protein